ncbi:lactonase family protein [Planctomicrobium sp. SH668]|uniref:lactonase family protein n=1 Tax=Planctomicrobium sp. SH668 TaxID=3448126 RepID=UPI003F5B1E96
MLKGLSMRFVTLFGMGALVATLGLFSVSTVSADSPRPKTIRVYTGTYTNETSEGVYLFEMDPVTWKATEPKLVAKIENPTYMQFDPKFEHLYVVSEVSVPSKIKGNKDTGFISAYKVDAATGSLTLLNTVESHGGLPCYTEVDKADRYLLIANYFGGNVASYPIQADGSLGDAICVVDHVSDNNEKREARGHSIVFSPDERFVVAADAGINELKIYNFDHSTGKLTPHSTPSHFTGVDTAPRHFKFHPNGKWAYNNNEQNFTAMAHHFDAEKGTLKTLQTITTLPEGVPHEGSTAECLLHPNGKFLYVSNRGPNSIAVYQIQNDGTLKFTGAIDTLGKIPRNFRFDNTGHIMLVENQDSGTIVLFNVDQNTGSLTATENVVKISRPVCIKMVDVY